MLHRARRSVALVFAAAAAVAIVPAAVSAAATTGQGGSARVPASLGGWGTAIEVPGTAALNRGGDAAVASVSCAAAGNCSAGGGYGDSSSTIQAYVVSETNGTWQKAEEVPGTAALNHGDAVTVSVSCAPAGNCSAGGDYFDGSFNSQPFVVSQTNGTWQKAEEVPGTAALNHGDADFSSVSCASAGECGAGGYYQDGSGLSQAFVVSRMPSRTS